MSPNRIQAQFLHVVREVCKKAQEEYIYKELPGGLDLSLHFQTVVWGPFTFTLTHGEIRDFSEDDDPPEDGHFQSIVIRFLGDIVFDIEAKVDVLAVSMYDPLPDPSAEEFRIHGYTPGIWQLYLLAAVLAAEGKFKPQS